MICASYDHNMLTFEVFLSLFFLFQFSYACLQKLYIHRYLWESFFSVHLHSYTRKAFSVYTRIKNSFSLYQHGLYRNSIPVQRLLFHFFQHTLVVYTKISLYTLITHTQEFLFTPYLHTHKIFPYIFLKTLFFSLYIDTTFVHNASFFFNSWCYHDFCSFYF